MDKTIFQQNPLSGKCDCIICHQKDVPPSDEHIIPKSIGGYMHSWNVCKQCNSKFGNKVDTKLVNHSLIKWDRYFHQLKGESGKDVPNPFEGTHVATDGEKYKNVTLHPLCRVTKVNVDGKKVVSFEYIEGGVKKTASDYDFIFLAAGAFEDTRIMMVSGLQDKTCVQFSDHIAKRIFNVKGSTKLGDVDMEFKISKFSFISKRIIGEQSGVSYFGYPAFNADYPFFQNLKKLLFGHKFTMAIVWAVLKDIPSAFLFAWRFFIQHRLYVYKNNWGLVLHMENPLGHGKVLLSDTLDKFGEKGISIDFSISPESKAIFADVANKFDKLLTESGIEHYPAEDAVTTRKFEDEYHPFALYSDFASVDEYYNQFENMLVIHSGVLPRAGGINSTSAAFPLLEEFIRYKMK